MSLAKSVPIRPEFTAKCNRLNSACLGCGPVPQRYVIVIMAALGLSFVFILRNTFSLALTEMRIQPKDSGKAKANLSEEEAGFVCPEPEVEKGEKQVRRMSWCIV